MSFIFKYLKLAITTLGLLCVTGCLGMKESDSQLEYSDFQLEYKVLKGNKILNLFGLNNPKSGDYFYVVGTIRRLVPQNAYIKISFKHNEDPTFKTSPKRISWIDGNNAAATIFILPIGIRNQKAPPNINNLSYKIKILMIK